MSDDAKDAGLMALISGILGGKRAEQPASEPHRLAEASPLAPTSAPATAPPAPEMPPTLQEEPLAASAPPNKPIVPTPAGNHDEKRARLPAVAIADLVLGELRKVDGFPKSGVSITVYGYRPWNAMIKFAPFSTTSENAARLRHALPDIVFKLRQYVDLEG
ncbi:hypothetical protein [Bradyrhizobium sp. CCGUVB23]|uniref:hypothetical protein n=1 Tax=Bradyrhizobium sp. CCGUVB23 TaxID=2949630 RepID=UPI0020B45655|nr:hypothetical protein [Bradyrhizobium sp. CCGUVB23]MCP3466581.1 hypothetical protein [Bradyrhizobium sp. CCGUVB23]